MPYVSLAQVRVLPGLADAVAFPDDALTAAVAWFEERFEDYTRLAWAPRASTTKLSGGRGTLLLPRYPVISVQSISYLSGATTVPFTAPELAEVLPVWSDGDENTGELYRTSGAWWPHGPLTVAYTHGRPTTPLDVQDACLVAVQDKLQQDRTNARGNRQFSVATQDGIIRSSTPGKDRPFGIPAVDEVANRRREHSAPAVA